MTDTTISFDLIDGELSIEIRQGDQSLSHKLTHDDFVHARHEMALAWTLMKAQFGFAQVPQGEAGVTAHRTERHD